MQLEEYMKLNKSERKELRTKAIQMAEAISNRNNNVSKSIDESINAFDGEPTAIKSTTLVYPIIEMWSKLNSMKPLKGFYKRVIDTVKRSAKKLRDDLINVIIDLSYPLSIINHVNSLSVKELIK